VKQEAFEREREARWQDFEAMLDSLESGGTATGDFPASYRRVCVDLALAGSRGFGASLVERLNQLALRGHQRLYGGSVGRVHPLDFFARRFPAAVRAQSRALAAAALVFYGTALLVFALDLRNPDLIYHVMSPDQVAMFEEMYDPAAEHFGTPRGTVGDFGAFAFYVSNNIGVALRTFAWGVFAGVGSLFLLVFNGIVLGLVAAHVTLAGHAVPFFSFVVGHSALELTAILLGGVAGLQLGWSLIAPGAVSRQAALRAAARGVVPLLYGTIAMLLMAAVVEAFWSSNRAISEPLKFGVGAISWALVVGWLGLGGRRRAH
jgi:uncharacterized membrane protein SpoIIM required for sporulation